MSQADLSGVYVLNRYIGTNRGTENYNPISHTLSFTTNPNGSLLHTYSWGNKGNTHGWSMDAPEDVTAVNAALNSGSSFVRTDDGSLVPYVEMAYAQLANPDNNHFNFGITLNCKYETANLLITARSMAGQHWWNWLY